MDRHKSGGVHGSNLHAAGEQEPAVPGGGDGSANVPDVKPETGLKSLFQRAHEYAREKEDVKQAYIDGWLARGRTLYKRRRGK